MPSFLNWQTAAIAASAAIPALLLLYFLKLRRREMDVPSTFLWKKSIQDLQVNAPFQRLRRSLLLFLQLALLIALLVALARPVMNYTPGAGSLAVILIDRSASMSARDAEDGRSRLEEAKRQASELVSTLEKDGSAMVIAFDDTAETIEPFTGDRLALQKAIESIQPTDRPSRLATAFQLAEAKATAFYADQLRARGEKPSLWLYSDGRVADRTELSLHGAELKYTRIGSDQTGNVAIVALNARRNYERPAEVEVFVRLANYGPEPVSTVLQLSVDGQVPPGGVKSGIVLVPERWTPEQREQASKDNKLFHQAGAEFNLELLGSAVIQVDLKELEKDELLADDSARVVIPAPRVLSVLLVSAKGNLWLEKFLESTLIEDTAVITPAAYEEKMGDSQAVATNYDLIFFDRYQPKTLPPAGNFIYFNAVPPEPVAPGEAANPRIAAARDANGPIVLETQLVFDWDDTHPTLRGLNLREVFAARSLKLNVPVEAHVLVDGRKGPLVALHRDGRQNHLVVGFDVQESNWPTHATFPIFFDNAIHYLALGAGMELRQSYTPGDTPRIPRFNLQQAAANVKRLTISGPGDYRDTVEVPPSGDFVLPALNRVGLYVLDPPVPQFERIAVNLLDDNESNLAPIDEQPGGDGEAINAGGVARKSRLDLWWWIVACAGIPLCMIEWWVYTRRVHL